MKIIKAIILAGLLLMVTNGVKAQAGQKLLQSAGMNMAIKELMIGDYYKFVFLDASGKKALSKDFTFIAFDPNKMEQYAVVTFDRSEGRGVDLKEKKEDGTYKSMYFCVLKTIDAEGNAKYLQKKKDANAACPFVLKNLQDFRRTMRLPKENGGYQVPTSDYSVHSYLYNVRPSKEHKGCVDLIYPTADHSCEVKKWKTVELLMVQIGDK